MVDKIKIFDLVSYSNNSKLFAKCLWRQHLYVSYIYLTMPSYIGIKYTSLYTNTEDFAYLKDRSKLIQGY
jgi:hypothetical protein